MKQEKITDSSYWDFVMEYLPCFSSDNRVLWSDILSRYLVGEEVDESDLRYIFENFKNRDEVVEELKRIDKILIGEAIDAYYDKLK